MTVVHRFELIEEMEIREINTTARLFRHQKTGAQLLSLENEDENKVFGITFRTTPDNSTGIPHIMEHSVLCGSEKYPVKEPFVELMKASLNTFLNAMTYPDKTCYPVASQNLQDFYNLVDVYMDAVLHPLITPHTLEQEGWHYELDDPSEPLRFKGVVYNEMKGAYSSPDNLMYKLTQETVFPDNTYGYDSGGDPAIIPQLTYEQFKRFHETYYHPSNALIYFYGDDDPEERLRRMDSYLQSYSKREVNAEVPLQPRFTDPVIHRAFYDAGEDTDGKKGMITVNWLLPESTDPAANLAFKMLTYILIGLPASPLRKALIDSGLGEDLVGPGLETDLRQMYFSTGLKGIALEDTQKVEDLIFATLRKLVEGGIEPDMVAAAVNTIEFRLRENNTGSVPRGLLLMLRALIPWLHGGDPIAPLAFEAPLEKIKEQLNSGGRYFENLIQEHLLDNSHRTTVILEPDPEWGQKKEEEERTRLERIREQLSRAELEAIVENTRILKQRQQTPDSPEALATIPTLELADLDREIKHIPLDVMEEGAGEILYHDLFTNGIVYIDVGFNLHALPASFLPYVNLFGRALLEMGTEREDFVKLSQRIARQTGGIHPDTFVSQVQDSNRSTAWLVLRGKATMEQSADLLKIYRDVLLDVKLDNRDRFRQMVLEEKANMEAALVPVGHRLVNTRLRAQFSEAGWADEQIDGISHLFFLRELTKAIENDWSAVLEKLEAMRRRLLNRQDMVFNVTLDQENWQGFLPRLNDFRSSLPSEAIDHPLWTPQQLPAFEGLTIPAQVNYVGKGANLYQLGYQLDGSIMVILNYLRATWLWERVRVQGGAYGGFCLFDQRSGVFNYLSYRDPNLLATLETYDQTSEFLRNLELSQEELSRSIIGAIGELDAYQLPDAKGYTSMQRHLVGITSEFRQQLRDQILSTQISVFQAFGDLLERMKDHGQVVVMGSQAALDDANTYLKNPLQLTRVL